MKAVNMKRNLAATMLFGLVLVLAAACPGADSNGGEPSDSDSDIVDPAVWEALEEAPTVEVFIALRQLESPLDEQTTQVAMTHAADVQTRVLASLTEADISAVHKHVISPAISATITLSGLEKLAAHPDVIGVELPGVGERGG